MTVKMNKTQKVNAAMDRAEDAAADLLLEAERLGKTDSQWDLRCYRRDVLKAARRYARAMDAITRVRSV